MDTGAFWAQYIQHVHSPATTDDEREAFKHHLHSGNNTDNSPHTNPSSSSLEKEVQTEHWPGCRSGHHQTSTSCYLYNMVLRNGGYTKEGWITHTSGRPTETQCYHPEETHHVLSPFNPVSMVPAHMKKTMLDALDGCHGLPLSPPVQDATMFITKWDRYWYLWTLQGFHALGDAYTCWFNDIIVDIIRKTHCIDDSILWNDSTETTFWYTIEYITHCGKNSIVFNLEKFHFAKEVEFTRFWITMHETYEKKL